MSESPSLSAAAPEFVPTPAPEDMVGDLVEKLEKVEDHFHEEMFKPFNGSFRNLTLFFPDGLATFDGAERWVVHPWFWSDFVQDDPWYETVNWRQYQQFKPLKYSAALLTPDSFLYLTGGLTDKLITSDRCVRARVSLNWGNRTEQIALISPLQTGRYLHGMVLVGSKLLVIGGQRKEEGKHVFLTSCESRVEEEWRSAPALLSPRSTFGTSVHSGNVYVFGGFADCGQVADGIEKLPAGAEAWVSVPVSFPMLAGMATAFSDPILWLIGGSDGQKATDRILAFDPATEVTTELVLEGEPVHLSVPRAKAIAFAVFGNRVFIFGGGNEEGEMFRNLKSEVLEYGHPPRVKEDWLLAAPVAIKSS